MGLSSVTAQIAAAQSLSGLVDLMGGRPWAIITPNGFLDGVYTTANDVAFNDRTAEAASPGGTPFVLFPTPATGDRAYFGLKAEKFDRILFDIQTAAAGNTPAWAFTWDYWNGAWTDLVETDGTTGFTVNGAVTWAPPGDWVQNSVNGLTAFWVRVRPTAVPTVGLVNPTVNQAYDVGWTGGTATDLTLQATIDNDIAVQDVYNDGGIELLIQADASRYITFPDMSTLDGLRYIKVRSGTAAAPVNQNVLRNIPIVTRF